VAAVDSSWARWARAQGLGPEAVLPMVHGRRSADTVALLVPPDRRDDALALVDRYELESAAECRTVPGARELLDSAPAGRWAVVTSGNRALATARLTAAGHPVPAVLVTAEDVAAGKPDPEGYRAAAAALGLAPEDTVVLEDSAAGVAAGLAAGARVLGVGEQALGTDATVVVSGLTGVRWTGEGLTVPEDVVLRAASPSGAGPRGRAGG
jgi:sugar-phosphatase